MKNHKLNIFKLLPIVLVFVFLFGALSVSASSNDIHIVDYSDCLSSTAKEDGEVWAVVDIPSNWSTWHVHPLYESAFAERGSCGVYWNQKYDGGTNVYYYPFGDASERLFSLDKIPLGSTLAIAFNFYYQGLCDEESYPIQNVYIEYYDINGAIVDSSYYETNHRTDPGNGLVHNLSFNYPTSAKYFSLRIDLLDWYLWSGEQDLSCDNPQIQIVMDNLTWDFIHTPIDSIKPEGDGTLDGLVTDEEQLKDYIQEGMEIFTGVFDDAITILSGYITPFAAVSLILSMFIDIPIFTALLSISLSLGVFASLLGVISLFGHSGDRAKMQTKGNRGKGE